MGLICKSILVLSLPRIKIKMPLHRIILTLPQNCFYLLVEQTRDRRDDSRIDLGIRQLIPTTTFTLKLSQKTNGGVEQKKPRGMREGLLVVPIKSGKRAKTRLSILGTFSHANLVDGHWRRRRPLRILCAARQQLNVVQ